MRKGFALPLVLVAVAIGIIIIMFMFFVGFSRVSTNKDTYLQGEEITVSYSDFRLLRFNTSPSTTNMFFYFETSGGWKRIKHMRGHVTWGGVACVDGQVVYGNHPGDIARFVPFIPYEKGVYTWDSRIFEKKGSKEICGEIKVPVDSFQSKYAPAGKYYVKFGRAKTTFKIKEAQTKELQNETANWKTYLGPGKDYSFKYLPTYPDPTNVGSQVSLLSSSNSINPNTFQIKEDELVVNFDSYPPVDRNETLEGFANEHRSWAIILKESKLLIGGVDAIHRQWEDQNGRGESYYMLYKSKGYVINKWPVVTSRQEEFDQILSTFQFID